MKRRAVLAAAVVVAALVFAGAVHAGTGHVTKAKKPVVVTTASGLKYEDLTVGTGATPKSGDHVAVHYVGTLEDGTVFDSSRARNTPFEFTVGVGQVIAGFDEGVLSMAVGGLRRVWIPPELGYGDRAIGKIPPRRR